MKNDANKTLLTIAYFGCVLVMLALVITLVIGLIRMDVALWSKICYITIAVALVGVIVFDCVCLYTRTSTYIAGFILYALTVAMVVVTFVLYSRLAIPSGLIPTADLSLFIFEAGNLIAINVLSIIIYCLGNINVKKQK